MFNLIKMNMGQENLLQVVSLILLELGKQHKIRSSCI